jgi:hypothetical protein
MGICRNLMLVDTLINDATAAVGMTPGSEASPVCASVAT